MAALLRTLNTSGTEILVFFPVKAQSYYYGILLRKLASGKWIIFSPDLDEYPGSYSRLKLCPLERNAAFPAVIDTDVIYAFDAGDIISAVLSGVRWQVRVFADVLGRPDPAPTSAPDWHYKWLGANAVLERFIEKILEEYKALGDDTTELVVADAPTRLQSLGGVAIKLERVNQFIWRGGMAENSAVDRELSTLFKILRLFILYDQCDPANSAAVEELVRCIIEIQSAVRKRFKHPDFDGLDVQAAAVADEVGRACAQAYQSWMADGVH